MSVKATAQITLSCVVDVQATYRYYLLQSSTLDKPAKPTTFPPASSWNDTEPTYTDGSTNSLYFVDCTVFCDDTFTYSEVSLSSSYEAAKAAYNKAVNAQNTANGVQDDLAENYYTITETEAYITAKADKIISSVSETHAIAGDAAARISAAESIIQQLSDAISMLVVDDSGTTLMEQTTEGWSFNIGGTLDSLNATAAGLSELEGSVEDTDLAVKLLQDAVAALEANSDYIRITTYNGQPCIELGEAENDFKLRITNTEIQFADGTVIPAYISNQKLNIEKAEIKDELQIGGFVLKKRSNGNVGFMWKGESD